MTKIMSLLAITTILSSNAMAEITEYNCKTEKGTALSIQFEKFPAELLKLTIDGKDMRAQVENFGASGGQPVFTVKDFPVEGKDANFKLSAYPVIPSTVKINGTTSNIPCKLTGDSNKPGSNEDSI